MTMSEMMRVYKMDMDQFETFALSKGYVFYQLENSEDYYGHTYVKGYKENTKYLTLYSRYFSYGNEVTYQTSNSNEYLNFKNQLKNFGFSLYLSKTFEDKPVKKYRNSIWEISIITIENGYEINLRKF
jgi:hypothetical protein